MTDNSRVFDISSHYDDTQSNDVMSDEEIKNVLNIPERDKETYPDIPKEVQLKAGSFLYKLNLLASGADGNLQSMVWMLYNKLDDYLHLGKDEASLDIANILVCLKDYISEHKNIIFDNLKSPEDDETKKDLT